MVQNVLFYVKKKNTVTLINAAYNWNDYLKLFLSSSSREGVELGGRGWRKAEGLEPICQLFKVALRKLNKDLVPSVKGGGGFKEHRL